MFSYKESKVYIHRRYLKPLYIGRIEQEAATFRIHDRDNYHVLSKSLGIDKELITTPSLEYRYIAIKFHNEVLTTTRKYFSDHSREIDLFNLRSMLFMEVRLFSLDKALSYEKELIDSAAAQIDIFEVAAKEAASGERLLDMYVKNLSNTIKNQGKEDGKEIQF
jgi:hypothetical protein